MSIPTITPAPSPIPARGDFTSDAAYSAAVDAWMYWWAGQPAEYNAFAPALVDAASNFYNATSVTSLAIGTGSKVFTIQTGKSFQPGQWVIAASTAAPTTNFMLGQVVTLSGATLTMSVASSGIGGSGTHADWKLSLSGPTGISGWKSITSAVALTGTGPVDFTGIKTSAAEYADIMLLIEGASATVTADIGISISANGTTWVQAYVALSAPAAATRSGGVSIPNFKRNVGLMRGGLDSMSSPAVGNPGPSGLWNFNGGVDALRISLSTGSFDAGTAQLWARI